MNIEEAKEELRVLSQAKQYFAEHEKRRVDSIDVNKRDFYDINGRDTLIKQIQSLDIAIKSLDMWNKVIDELEEYKIIGSQMECFGTTEENAKEYIPIDTALDIINKHLKETEKCEEMGRTLGENE